MIIIFMPQSAPAVIDYDNLPEPHLDRYPGAKGIAIEDIVDLQSRGLSNTQIAKVLGCDHSNISRRLRPLIQTIDHTHKYRKNRALLLAYEQQRIRQAITDADIAKASLRDKVLSIAILFDKERLESGLSTQNIAYADIVKARDQAKDELKSLEQAETTGGVGEWPQLW